MAAPVPHTFAFGELLTAANLNTITNTINYVSTTLLGNVKGITIGKTTISPTANAPTSLAVTGLTTVGTNFLVVTGPDTQNPGQGSGTNSVLETSANNVTGTDFVLWIYRTSSSGTPNTPSATGIWWWHIGWS